MGDITKKNYRLIFHRQVKNGFTIAEVKKNLQQFFNKSEDTIEQLFFKDQTTLMKNISKLQAEKYKSALEAIGAYCSVNENTEKVLISERVIENKGSFTKKLNDLESVTRFLVRVISFYQKMIWVLFALMFISMAISVALYFKIQNKHALDDSRCTKTIDFSSKADRSSYQVKGLGGFEDWGRWSSAKNVIFTFTWTDKSCQYSTVEFNLKAFLTNKTPLQSAMVSLNGVFLGEISIKNGQYQPRKFEFSISPGIYKQGVKNKMSFKINAPVSPLSLGLSKDARTLGFGFYSFKMK